MTLRNVGFALAGISVFVSVLIVYGHFLFIGFHALQPSVRQQKVDLAAEQQFKDGIAYAYGQNVQRDEQKAMALFIRAGEGGLADAQFILGDIYYHGFSVVTSQNYSKAYIWYSLAAETGYKRAAALRYEISANLSPAELAAANEEVRRIHASNNTNNANAK